MISSRAATSFSPLKLVAADICPPPLPAKLASSSGWRSGRSAWGERGLSPPRSLSAPAGLRFAPEGARSARSRSVPPMPQGGIPSGCPASPAGLAASSEGGAPPRGLPALKGCALGGAAKIRKEGAAAPPAPCGRWHPPAGEVHPLPLKGETVNRRNLHFQWNYYYYYYYYYLYPYIHTYIHKV